VGPPRAGVSLVAVDASAAAGKLYEVRLAEKTTTAVVELVTERAHNAAPGDEMLQLAGFEVPGAVRQWGTVDVQAEGNWQIVWGETNHVRTVDGGVGPAHGDTRFEYFVQPYALAARVVPQKTRIRVEPQYVLLVGAEQARLEARLKYTIRGAKVRSLRVRLADWQIDEVGPAALVDVDSAIAGAGESLVIPLLQETGGEVEVTFSAVKKIDPRADRVTMQLPEPQVDVVAADLVVAGADLAVASDDNVELVPLPEAMAGLAPSANRPTLGLPERQQEPLFYRSTGTAAKFAAAMKLHEQSISAVLAAQLTVGRDETAVEQQLAFQIAYQPTDHLTLIVPRSVPVERMTVQVDGARVALLAVRPALLRDTEKALYRVNLPTPRIGRCELAIGYVVPHERPRAEASTLVSVPLVVPAEGQLSGNTLTVMPKSGIVASYPPGPWRETSPREQAGDAAALALTAERAIPEVTLGVSSTQSPGENSTIVERALILTNLTPTGRQDRAMFRLSSRQERIEASLPEGTDMRSLSLAVDGAQVVPESVRQRQIVVPLPESARGEHLLEMRYRFVERDGEGSLRLAGPRLSSANWVQQLYWQLTLPENEQLLFAPTSHSEESSWAWSGFYWQRQPTLVERELESWIAAGLAGDSFRPPAEPARQAAGANRYVFSGAGTIEPLEVYTLSRARLVLVASLPVLLCGLALIYFPVARHPAALFVLAVVVAAGSFVAPRSALVLAQASVLGLALAGIAALLAQMLPRPAPATIPVRGSSQSLRERSVTERYPRLPAPSVQPPSTATDPLVPTSGEVNP
jgi:hypothetical protein